MKRVLFVTYDYPYPTNTGGKNRAYNMLAHSGPTFRKYLFSFVRPDFNKEYIKEVAKISVETVGTVPRRKVKDPANILGLMGGKSIFKTLYYSKKIEEQIIALVRRHDIDIVHFESYFTGFYISKRLAELGVKQVYGSENIEHKLYHDIVPTAPFFLRPLYRHQVERIYEDEKSMFRKADISLVVSEADFREGQKYNKCAIVRNGVDLDVLKYAKPKGVVKNLMFVGNFTYYPNVDAINYFYEEVFKKMSGDYKLIIVGKKITKLPLSGNPKVEAIEFVSEISDAYARADIIVAPVRLGGGTNFKILEAMAAGVPVVSLPHRLEGLKVMDRKNIMVAKNAKEFMDKINQLAENHKLRTLISKNARDLVESEYSWKVSGEHLAAAWNSL